MPERLSRESDGAQSRIDVIFRGQYAVFKASARRQSSYVLFSHIKQLPAQFADYRIALKGK